MLGWIYHDNRNGDLHHFKDNHDSLDHCSAHAYCWFGHRFDDIGASSRYTDQRDDINLHPQNPNDHCGVADFLAVDDYNPDRFCQLSDDCDANADQIEKS